MFRQMSEQDRAVFQGMIDTLYGRFLEVVTRARRDVAPERLRALADGRVYLGEEALANGLIDEIGDLRAAIGAAKERAGLGGVEIKVVQYSRPYAHRPNIYARGDTPPAQVNVINVDLPEWLTGPAPQFMYVWAPGW
jgi:protease-4